jgi:uncharacterized membrane protein
MRRFATETSRVEAFSDGVLAVIITIMVLELRPPSGIELRSLLPTLPAVATYALSASDVAPVAAAILWLVPDRRFEPLIKY